MFSVDDMVLKYETLLLLRQQREAAAVQAHRFSAADGRARRAQMRALATAYPGALRELDRLSAQQLEARLMSVRAGQAGAAPPLWLQAVQWQHQLLRESAIPVDPVTGRRMPALWREVARRIGTTPEEAARLVDTAPATSAAA